MGTLSLLSIPAAVPRSTRATSSAAIQLSPTFCSPASTSARESSLRIHPSFSAPRHGERHGVSTWRRRHLRLSASREEVPAEVLEDSKFVRINDEDPRFGPPALLLLGFTNEEAVKVQNLLKEMEGDFMEVLLCTEEMAQGNLGQAVSIVQPNLLEVQVAKGAPRITFISGLTGEEIMMLIQIFPDAGLESTVFAAHVPKNSDKSMKELMEEIMDDHERLSHGRAEE